MSTYPASRRRLIFAWLVGGALLLLLASPVVIALVRAAFPDVIWHPATGYSFPEQSRIARMHVIWWRDSSESSDGVPAQWEFDIPEQFWPRVIAGLSPSERDKDPAKWGVLGELGVELTNGDKFVIDVYNVRGPGAFSAGPTFESRRYYRGGKSKRIARVIRDAHAAVEERVDAENRANPWYVLPFSPAPCPPVRPSPTIQGPAFAGIFDGRAVAAGPVCALRKP